MTQAPTPGPLSEAQIQSVMLAAMKEVRPSITDHVEAACMDADILRLEREAVDMGETGWAVMRATARRFADLLAPTAPVKASGSERDGPEVGEDAVAKILAPYLPLINSTPDLLSILYDADLMPEQAVTVRGAICVAAVCEAHKAALRPQPSGETREAVARLEHDLNTRNLYREEDGHFVLKVREDDLRALLSARPLALEGQQGVQERCQRCGGEVQGWLCQSCPAEFRENDDGHLVFDEDTTPARAEAQDEGAAAEPVATHKGFIWKNLHGQECIGWFLPREFMHGSVIELYAHPSPTPAADDDRVREAIGKLEWRRNARELSAIKEALDTQVQGKRAEYKARVLSNALVEVDYDALCVALAALKSTAAKEGGE